MLTAFAITGCGVPGKGKAPQTVSIGAVAPTSSSHPLEQGTKAQITISEVFGQISTSGTKIAFASGGTVVASAPVTAETAGPPISEILSFTVPQLGITSPTQFSISVAGETTEGGSIQSGSSFTATIYPGPSITSITPPVVQPGQQVSVDVEAANANFVQGTTTANFGAGISVGGAASGASGPVTVNGNNSITASISVDPAAASGVRTVTVTTGDETATSLNGLTVESAATAPVARPGGPYTGTTGQAIVFSGTASTDPDGLALTYAWDFGDGSQGSGGTPTHTYSKAGSYTVKLTVTDTSGLSASANTTATVATLSAPVASTGGPYAGKTGQSITFDASASTDPNNSPLSYAWNFGDGATGSGVKAMHTYANAGTYTVTLTLTDGDNETATATTIATITNASQPPVANPGGPYTGTIGQAIAFNGSGSTDQNNLPLTYAWDFGDGSTGSQAMPVHTYGAAGSYTVKLTVSDSSGLSASASTTATITAPTTLTASPGGPYTATVGSAISFNGSASYDPKGETLTYAWDFGDGSQGTTAAPSHTYTQAGTYTVTLTVTNTDGATASATTTATVSAVLSAVLNGPYSGNVSQVISFSGAGSTGPGNDTLTYAWNFGDGATTSGSTVTHAYTAAGTFAVSLTVTDTVTSSTASTTASAVITQPLSVAVTSPTQGALFNTSTVNVSGTVDGQNATVQVNGVAATVSGGSFTAANVPIREGVNLITAVASDSQGNSGTASTSVTVDMTAPTVSVFLPKDGSTVTTQQVTVTGMVTDIVTGTVNSNDVTVTVNGQTAAVANRSFELPGLLLVPGVNTLNLVATDKAGNQSTGTVHVTLASTTAQQHAVILSGDQQTAAIASVLPQPLVAELVDANGAPIPNRAITFTVTASDGIIKSLPQQGQTLTLVTDASGKASVLFQLGSRVGLGINQVSVTSPGFLGQAVFSASTTGGTPTFIHEFMGNNQRGLLGQPLAEAFQAIVQDSGGNPVAGVPVTFTVTNGDGTLDGETTTTVDTNADGRAMATLTLGQQEGINNYRVGADFSGDPNAGITFYASGYAQGDPNATQVSGLVLDNGGNPVPNATVSLQNTNLRTVTDANGHFSISPAPVGTVTLLVDGSTTTLAETLPTLTFVMQSLPGQNNTLNMPVYLPLIDSTNAQTVGGDQPVTLTMTNLPGVALTIAANSVTFPDGTHIGQMSLSQVKSDLIPMPPPNGIQPDFAWTLQPAGTKFSVPAQITIPNTKGLPPGQVQEFYQYDHDLEQFVSVGTLRVSPDGSVLNSDPGFGVTKAGWSSPGAAPPPFNCFLSCDDHNDCTSDLKAPPPNCYCVHINVQDGSSCGTNSAGPNNCQKPGTCKGGACSGPQIAKGKTCNDGKYCTTMDICQADGSCKGTKRPDQPLPLPFPQGASVTTSFENVNQAAQSAINSFLKTTGVQFELQAGDTAKGEMQCCEETQDYQAHAVEAYQVSVGVTSPKIPIPDLSITLVGAGFIGVYGQFGVEGSGSVGAQFSNCENKKCGYGSVEIAGSVTLGLGAQLSGNVNVPYFGSEVSVGAKLTSGVSFGVETTSECDNGWEWALKFQGVTGSLYFTDPKGFSVNIPYQIPNTAGTIADGPIVLGDS